MNLAKLTKDLNKLNKSRFILELLICAFIGWGSQFLFLFTSNDSIKVFLFFISTFSIYRGLSFIHEVGHFCDRIKFFNLLYNLLFGIPCRVPAYSMKTHRYHHGVKTFGTINDPEYENWTARSKIYLVRPFVLSFFYPLILAIRFGIVPIFFIFFSKETVLKIYTLYSSFVMNLKFERPFHQGDFKEMKRTDFFCSLYFFSFSFLLLKLDLFVEYYFLFYIQIVFISIMNTYRALVAHRYKAHLTDDKALMAQTIDSVTIEGGVFTELWAPISLRYHSTHHLLPNIPYYNLKKAHLRLLKELPSDHFYFKTIEKSFLSAFIKLFKSCS